MRNMGYTGTIIALTANALAGQAAKIMAKSSGNIAKGNTTTKNKEGL